MNSLLAFLNTYEPTISAAVGLVTLIAASLGLLQLAILPFLAQIRTVQTAAEPTSVEGRSFRLWASLLDRGLNPRSDLIEQVSVRTTNACLLFTIAGTLTWLVVTLLSGDLLILSVLNLLAFLLLIGAYNLQAAGYGNTARWLMIITLTLYWGLNIVVMGTRVGLEYFLGDLLILPLMLFAKEQKRELYLALALVLITLPLAIFIQTQISFALPPSYVEIIPGYYYTNAVFLAVMVLLILYSYNRSADESFTQLEDQMQQSDELIQRILPAYIARKVASQETTVADWHSEASVLFATVHGFESLYKRVSAVQLVEILSEVFGEFDEILSKSAVEKINTLGTHYVAATGISPESDARCADLARAALKMRDIVSRLGSATKHPFTLTVGISTGDLVSGVIGEDRPSFDIWGATVELANEMRGDALGNTIVLSEAAFWRLRNDFVCESIEGEDRRFLLCAEI